MRPSPTCPIPHLPAQPSDPNPLHVAVIMDGNGRWATARGLPRVAGHRAGVTAARSVIERAPDLGIGVLTLYAFSSDNWRRPAPEVESLLLLLRTFLRLEAVRLSRKGVRLEAIGRRDRLPAPLLKEIERAERLTATGDRLLLRVAIDYSARWTLAATAAEVATALLDRPHAASGPTGAAVEQAIGHRCREVDLLIRTGGEQRLSDFLLWECAYAELHFTPTMWPDFRGDDLAAALRSFAQRERRFGALPDPPHPATTAAHPSPACP